MKALLALVVAVAVVVGLAGAFVPSQAATVAGTSISQNSLDSDLSAIAHSGTYACYLAEEGLTSTAGAGVGSTATGDNGIYSTTFTDAWLQELVLDQLRARLAARRGLTVTPADLVIGRAALTRQVQDALTEYAEQAGTGTPGCGGSAAAVLGSMPSAFIDEEARSTAEDAVLAARAVGTNLTSSGLSSYYAAHRSRFDVTCIGLLEFTTATMATAADAAITGGTTFGAEEKAIEATTANASSEVAGTKCFSGTGAKPTSVLGAKVGQVMGPLKESSTFPYLITDVISRKPRPLSAVRGLVITSIITAGATSIEKGLTGEIKHTHIAIDPRYGTVSLSAHGFIAPPASPPLASVLSGAAATPPGASAGG